MERIEIVDEEEVVEELGEVEQEVNSKFDNTSTPSDIVDDFVEFVEPSFNELEFGVEEDNAQPPEHIMNDEELEDLETFLPNNEPSLPPSPPDEAPMQELGDLNSQFQR